MAPEVAKEEPYNLSADVYSFGILLWEIMSLSPPFPDYSCKMHNDLVIHKGYRPTCNSAWPEDLTRLIKECWNDKASKRPIFPDICKSIYTLTDEENEEPELDLSRKSAKSYCNSCE
mmetsp:Transcript_18837/g.26520  ORF Transcript_18837/g.26520 Transcript_18837/m.26520 type:complete len:117 (+) Transcript_18837:979-1329(+)